MRFSRILAVALASGSVILSGCSGGSPAASPVGSAPPSNAAINVSLHDSPMMSGFNILAFRATLTGATLQPGNISVINSPMTIEMTQLQSMSAYLSTISVPPGNYTSMTVNFANPRMTVYNATGFGGMMGGLNCPSGQICELSPPMLSTSETLSGAPFPLNAQAGTPMGLTMDLDLMGSFQGSSVWTMGFSPMMSSFLDPSSGVSGAFGKMFDEMDGMPGVVGSVDAADQQFTMQFVQGAPTLTIHVDDKTVFDGFDAINQPNAFSSLAQGQIVEVDLELEGTGTLYAKEVDLENSDGQEIYGMLVGLDPAGGWCDVVVMDEAPAFNGVSIGNLIRMNLQQGAQYGVDFPFMGMSGINFSGFSDLMLGQMVQFRPLSALTSGTPPSVNVGQLRLMRTWVTGTISRINSATDFTLTPNSGIFSADGLTSLHVTTSSQTRFGDVSGVGGLSVGDTVSLRGPAFLSGGNPMLFATYVLKR